MTDRNIILRAFVYALGVALYVISLAGLINNLDKLDLQPTNHAWLAPAMFLMAFIISACVTGSLVLLKPILLYFEGRKKEAVHLFIYTLIFLGILALVVGIFVVRAI